MRRVSARRWMLVVLAAVLVTLLGGVAVLAATLTGGEEPAVATERPRPPLPEGSVEPGRAGAEDSAVAMATELQAVPLRRGGTCPADRLDVSWRDPSGEYHRGSHVTPVGPAPERGTRRVNGVVRCRRSHFAYAGFTAQYLGGRWQVAIVPNFDENEGEAPPGAAGADDRDEPRDGPTDDDPGTTTTTAPPA
ncbi:MAG: hypothetical protein KDB35_15285, partial [Acidimicrobiales bacterium]|nr:hypothetical protein [Acidimicrobiales bacterium]